MTDCLSGWVMFSPRETHQLGRPEQLGQRVRSEAKHFEIDQLVLVPKAVCSRFMLVQRRRTGRLDASADQTDEKRSRWSGSRHSTS